MHASQTHSRINITLPKSTLNLLRKATIKRHRSEVVDLAVRHYIHSLGKKFIRQGLVLAGRERSSRDLEIVKEFALMKDL